MLKQTLREMLERIMRRPNGIVTVFALVLISPRWHDRLDRGNASILLCH